jgi:hypothetical protein
LSQRARALIESVDVGVVRKDFDVVDSSEDDGN